MNDLVKVILPSCSTERLPMLIRTCGTVMAQTHQRTKPLVVADGNVEIFNAIRNLDLCALFNETRRDWIYSINRVVATVPSDFYVYASDDLIFDPDCIKNAMAVMRNKFPDGDGVVSIRQILEREKGCSTAFGMFGTKFADRFPNRAVFCPDYVHYYSDAELGRVAAALNRLAHCENATVKHSRPRDETWRLAHTVLNRDKTVRQDRRKRGFEWGLDFELMSKSPKTHVDHAKP